MCVRACGETYGQSDEPLALCNGEESHYQLGDDAGDDDERLVHEQGPFGEEVSQQDAQENRPALWLSVARPPDHVIEHLGCRFIAGFVSLKERMSFAFHHHKGMSVSWYHPTIS
jgi:hypothetical protein